MNIDNNKYDVVIKSIAPEAHSGYCPIDSNNKAIGRYKYYDVALSKGQMVVAYEDLSKYGYSDEG